MYQVFEARTGLYSVVSLRDQFWVFAVLVFVNSLPSWVMNKCKMFADNMKIYLKVAKEDVHGMLWI